LDVVELLGDGVHLVGHSYGGVVAMLAAGLRPQAVRSLTLIEPLAPRLAAHDPSVAAALERMRKGVQNLPEDMTPEEYLRLSTEPLGINVPAPTPLTLRAARSASGLVGWLRCREPPCINPLVDFYNALSLRHVVPAGGFNLAQLDDYFELRLTRREATFHPLDSASAESVELGEVAYASGNEVLTRHFVWKQSHKEFLGDPLGLLRVRGGGPPYFCQTTNTGEFRFCAMLTENGARQVLQLTRWCWVYQPVTTAAQSALLFWRAVSCCPDISLGRVISLYLLSRSCTKIESRQNQCKLFAFRAVCHLSPSFATPPRRSALHLLRGHAVRCWWGVYWRPRVDAG
jgi:B3/4 domain/alpha/beta hydrolase fold